LEIIVVTVVTLRFQRQRSRSHDGSDVMDRLKYLTAEALMFDIHRPEMSQIIRCEMCYVRCEGRRVSIDTAHSTHHQQEVP
jgi:hypothetical protein